MGKGKNNFWLDDDPEWEALRRRVNKKSKTVAQPQPVKPNYRMTPRPVATAKIPSPKPVQSVRTEPLKQPAKPKKVEVSLKLTVPKIRLPKVRILKLSRFQKKLGIGIAGLAVVGIVGIMVKQVILSPGSGEGDATGVLAETAVEPEFDTVLPEGKSDQTNDGKVGYDAQKRVASFKDTIGTAEITLSQQELPEPFKANPDEEVKKLAEGFSATGVINESNPKAYIGSDTNGAQTVIFHKNGVLVFILSNKQIDDDQWAEYITKLL